MRTRIWIRPTGSRPDVNGSLGSLLDWVKVCATNKSEVELLIIRQRTAVCFWCILGNLPMKEELSARVGWCMVYSSMQVLAGEGSTIGEVPRKTSPGGQVWYPQVFFRLSRRCIIRCTTS